MKFKNADNKSHWNMTVFCDQWKGVSDLNISHGKKSDFVSFPLFGFNLVMNLRNFNFESYLNTLIFLSNKIMSDVNMPLETLSNLV